MICVDLRPFYSWVHNGLDAGVVALLVLQKLPMCLNAEADVVARDLGTRNLDTCKIIHAECDEALGRAIDFILHC